MADNMSVDNTGARKPWYFTMNKNEGDAVDLFVWKGDRRVQISPGVSAGNISSVEPVDADFVKVWASILMF